MNPKIIELALYATASAIAFGVDMGSLALLVDCLHYPYLLAAALSFVLGGTVLYLLSIKWVFKYRRIQSPLMELPYFVALGIVGLVLNLAIIYIAVEIVHLHYLIGKICAAAFTFIANFALRKIILFSPRP